MGGVATGLRDPSQRQKACCSGRKLSAPLVDGAGPVVWCGRRDPGLRMRMTRRAIIVALISVSLISAALAWPAGASAQGMPVIGFLHSGGAQVNAGIVDAFRQGLKETGYTEKNLKIEFRWAEDHNERLPALAADLIHRGVAVIAANSVSAVAARAATSTIPIVFQSGIDPVVSGLVASLGHPGGNTTGVSFFASTLEVKKLEVAHELIPRDALIAVLVNPNNPQAGIQAGDQQAAAALLKRPLTVVKAGSEAEINAAFADSMPAASSRARNPPTFRCCSRPSSR
jgi:putative tryptophan/tyrosine transport system substrate-binding protein